MTAPLDTAGLVSELKRWAQFESARSASVLIAAADALTAKDSELAEARAALDLATAFDLGSDIQVESRGNGNWVVKNFGNVLGADGLWEWEPRPSSRDDEFIARTRFNRDEAIRRARTVLSREKEASSNE